MAFTLSGTTITQTGTDTNLSGLSSISGVTTQTWTVGTYTYTIYRAVGLDLVINGTLTINPEVEMGIFRKGLSSSGTLNFGKYNTDNGANKPSVMRGLEFIYRSANHFSDPSISWSGLTKNFIGGQIQIDGGYLDLSGTGTLKDLKIFSPITTSNGTGGLVKVGNNTVINNLELYGCGLWLSGVMPSTFTGYTPSSVLAAAIDSQYLNVGNTVKVISESKVFGATNKFEVLRGSRMNFINWDVGSNANITFGDNSSTSEHIANNIESSVRHTKQLKIKTVNSSDVAVSGSIIYTRDKDNGLRRNPQGETDNLLNDIVYINTTDSNGNTPTIDILTAFSYPKNPYSHTASDKVKIDFRSKSGNVNALFEFYVLAYNFQIGLSELSLLGNGVLNEKIALINDSNITLTEANAILKLASSFVVNTVNNTITVISNSTLDDLYDIMKVYKTRNVKAQLEYPTIDMQPMVPNGDVLTTSMQIIGFEFLTAGTKFKKIQANGVANAVISNLEIIGNVIQNTPTNLTNTKIIGTLTYNTNTNVNITITDAYINTIENLGTGIVTINKVNSTIDTYIDAEINFMDSSISVIGADSVTIHPTATDRDLNQNVSATFTNTYSFKYGSLVNGSTIGGTLYLRCVAGGIPFNVNKTIVMGDNVKDLGITALLSSLGAKIDTKPTLAQIEASAVLAKKSQVDIVNRNTIKASKLIPASEII